MVWIEKMTEITLEKRYSSARQALETLRSGLVQSATATRSVLRKIPKPAGTWIKLDKSPEKLKITIPAPGLRQFTKYSCLGLLSLLSFSSIFFIFVLVASVSLITLNSPMIFLFGLFFTVSFVVLLMLAFAIFLVEVNHVEFSRNYLNLRREVLNFIYAKENLHLTKIVGVFLQKEGKVYQVNLRSEDRTYRLGGALGENESAWLAQEIQDWLNQR